MRSHKIQGNRVFEAVSSGSASGTHVSHHSAQAGAGVARPRLTAAELVAVVPDQISVPRRSLFVPFFGIATATIPNVWTMRVRPVFPSFPLTFLRDADGRGPLDQALPAVRMTFPVVTTLPTPLRMNRFCEEIIRDHPQQYLCAPPLQDPAAG